MLVQYRARKKSCKLCSRSFNRDIFVIIYIYFREIGRVQKLCGCKEQRDREVEREMRRGGKMKRRDSMCMIWLVMQERK
jgi:hypothetical protein